MTRNKIISDLFTGKNFNDCLNKMEPDHLREDLKQEVILIICELPEEKLIEIYNSGFLIPFTVRVIQNLIRSNTSPFFKKYRKHIVKQKYKDGDEDSFKINLSFLTDINVEYLSDHQAGIECQIDTAERELRELIEDMAVEEIDKLYWYNKGLIALYTRHMNYRALEKETGIPWQSCYKTIRKSFDEIKEKVTR